MQSKLMTSYLFVNIRVVLITIIRISHCCLCVEFIFQFPISSMSSITVDGIVAISKGEWYLPPKAPTGTKSLHIHYNSVIQTASGKLSMTFYLKDG